MFFTIWTVTKFKYDSAIWAAYFMEENDALKFAKSEVKKIDDDFDRHVYHSYDGSKSTVWSGYDNEVWVDNDSWVEDDKYGKPFLHLKASGMEFENIDAIKAYCKESQMKVENN